MLVFAVLLSIAVAQNLNTCPGSISQTGWCDCAPANSGIVLQQFFFTPNPPVPGQNITGSITVKDVYCEWRFCAARATAHFSPQRLPSLAARST
jgi:hypothetical protein